MNARTLRRGRSITSSKPCSHEVSTMAMICNWAHPDDGALVVRPTGAGIAGAPAGHEREGGGS